MSAWLGGAGCYPRKDVPVTPFHLGPGLVLKAAGGRWFSLTAFAAVQVLIDVEVVANLLLRRHPLHHRLHTLAGALAVAAVVALGGKAPLSRLNLWLGQLRGWGRFGRTVRSGADVRCRCGAGATVASDG